jgi:hypothetical protein
VIVIPLHPTNVTVGEFEELCIVFPPATCMDWKQCEYRVTNFEAEEAEEAEEASPGPVTI